MHVYIEIYVNIYVKNLYKYVNIDAYIYENIIYSTCVLYWKYKPIIFGIFLSYIIIIQYYTYNAAGSICWFYCKSESETKKLHQVASQPHTPNTWLQSYQSLLLWPGDKL